METTIAPETTPSYQQPSRQVVEASILQSLKWRYAVKMFDKNRKIPASDWKSLEEALLLSPSSFGLQPWKFLVVQDPEVRKKLTPVSWGQTQVEDCSHYVVFAAKTSLDEKYVEEFISDTANKRGVPRAALQGYYDMIVNSVVKRAEVIPEWAARQAYLSMGVLLTASAALRIDACPLEGIEPTKYDEILGLKEEGYRTLAACALGYRSESDKYAALAKVRFPKEKLIRFV